MTCNTKQLLCDDVLTYICDFVGNRECISLSLTNKMIHEYVYKKIFVNRVGDYRFCRNLSSRELVNLALVLGPTVKVLNLERENITYQNLIDIGKKCKNLVQAYLSHESIGVFEEKFSREIYVNTSDEVRENIFLNTMVPPLYAIPKTVLNCLPSAKEITLKNLILPDINIEFNTKNLSEYDELVFKEINRKFIFGNYVYEKNEKFTKRYSEQVELMNSSQIDHEIARDSEEIKSLVIRNFSPKDEDIEKLLKSKRFSNIVKLDLSYFKLSEQVIKILNESSQKIEHLILHVQAKKDKDIKDILRSNLFKNVNRLELNFCIETDSIMMILNEVLPNIKQLKLDHSVNISSKLFQDLSDNLQVLPKLEKLEINFPDIEYGTLEAVIEEDWKIDDVIYELSAIRPELFFLINGPGMNPIVGNYMDNEKR